jgi:hypothetical protein
MVVRFHHWYVENVVFPLGGICAMSFAVFWMPIEDYISRCEVAVALLLSIIALKFTVSSHIPRVYYSTAFDLYVSTMSMMVLIPFGESVVAYTCDEGKPVQANGQYSCLEIMRSDPETINRIGG